MKKFIFWVLTFLFSMGTFSADFKWNHKYQVGSSKELFALSNKLCNFTSARMIPTEGFTLERPALSVKFSKGNLYFENYDDPSISTILFEGEAFISFSVENIIEQERLERFIGKKSLVNEKVSQILIIPLGSNSDLPKDDGKGSAVSTPQSFFGLKESLRKNLMKNLYYIFNRDLMSELDIMVVFKMKDNFWAYFYDSLSETEITLSRLAHPPNMDYFFWDEAVAIHRNKNGFITPEIQPQEMETKYFFDTKNYEIDYELDEKGKVIKGEATVKVSLKKAHRGLVFDFFPNYSIENVKVDGEECYFIKEDYSEKWGYLENEVFVAFKSKKEGEINITFSISGKLFKEADGYLYLQDEDFWYPKLEDWDGATYKIKMKVPKENEVISVGELVEHKIDESGYETYIWQSDIPVNLATFVLGKFIHKKLDAEGISLDVALPKGVRTNLLTQAQDYTLNELKNCVSFYSRLFGSLPYKTLKVAVTLYSHGRGFPTMLLITDAAFFRFGSTWPDQLMAHEVSHQWWGNLVDGLSYRDLWLSEGMAEFSSMLYMGARFGEEKIKFYNSELISNGIMVKSDSADTRTPFEEGPICLGGRLYTTTTTQPSLGYKYVIYTKGCFVFQMLKLLSRFTPSGTDGFFNGLKNIYSKYKGKKIITSIFFKELQESMKVPLSDFLKSWYESSGIPKVEIKYETLQKNGKYYVTAEGKCGKPYFFGVPLRVTLQDKRKFDYILLFNNKTAKGEWLVPQKPKDIDIDPVRIVFCLYGKVK